MKFVRKALNPLTLTATVIITGLAMTVVSRLMVVERTDVSIVNDPYVESRHRNRWTPSVIAPSGDVFGERPLIQTGDAYLEGQFVLESLGWYAASEAAVGRSVPSAAVLVSGAFRAGLVPPSFAVDPLNQRCVNGPTARIYVSWRPTPVGIEVVVFPKLGTAVPLLLRLPADPYPIDAVRYPEAVRHAGISLYGFRRTGDSQVPRPAEFLPPDQLQAAGWIRRPPRPTRELSPEESERLRRFGMLGAEGDS